MTAPALPNPMPADITIGDKYGPAMTIADQAEADAYFERCVAHSIAHGRSRSDAEYVERCNLGYYAGYYDHETRVRVERLFGCAHPVFGCATTPRVGTTEGGERG